MNARHGDALRWFMKNAETEATYAELYCLGLVMGYKAIYKPRGADCALSRALSAPTMMTGGFYRTERGCFAIIRKGMILVIEMTSTPIVP